MVKETNTPIDDNNSNKTIRMDKNELDIHELEAVTGGNAGILDWLPDALENKITTVEKPEFKQQFYKRCDNDEIVPVAKMRNIISNTKK